MPRRKPSASLRPGRVACLAVVCALSAGAARWCWRWQDGGGAGPGVSHGGSTRDLPGKTVIASGPRVPLKAETLPFLPLRDSLTLLAEQLPRLTVEEIRPMVVALTLRVSEGRLWGPSNTSKVLLKMLFTRWAELDAAGMIATLEGVDWRFYHSVRGYAVSAWAERAGVAAVEAIGKKWPGIANNVAWEVLYRQPQAMEALLPWLQGSAMVSSCNGVDLRPALGIPRFLTLALALDEPGEFEAAIRQLAPGDPPEAVRLAQALPEEKLRDQALNAVLGFLEQGVPFERGTHPDFGAIFQSLPPGRVRDRWSPSYAQFLTGKDPAAALEWARALPWGPVRRESLIAVLHCLYDAPPGTSLPLYAEAVMTDPGLSLWLRQRYEKWYHRDAAAAEAWRAGVSEPRLQKELATALRDALEDQAGNNGNPPVPPADVLSAAINAAEDAGRHQPPEHPDVVRVRELAESGDWDQALEIFNGLPGAERSALFWYQAARQRLKEDAGAASALVDTLPPGVARDAAAAAVVEYLAGTPSVPLLIRAPFDEGLRDGPAAFAWAAGMSGENERIRYMSLVAQAWWREDPAAARAALAAADLPDAEKQSVLRRLVEP